jgi:peptidoglycan/xylan/chitin deacetylase (PgdA/CDA1 family)
LLYRLSSLLLALCLLLWLLKLASVLWLVLGLGLRAVLIVVGSFVASAGVFGRILLSGRPDRPLVALTFDDGPDPTTTPKVLDVLARHRIQATFFVIGERASRHPELIRRLVEAGHQIENHSHRHSWATAFGPQARLSREFALAQHAIVIAGAPTPRYFRAPIGVLSPPIVAAARQLQLEIVAWSAKAKDGWASTSVHDAVSRLERALKPGAILLLHDGAEQLSAQQPARQTIAPDVLEHLLPLLQARGLRAVTLDELFA